MPKEIYINKSVLNTAASISAFGNSGRNYLTQSDQEAGYNNYSESCLAYSCIETVYIDKPITFSNAITNRGTNIIDVSILMTTYASANGIDFTNSTFYKNRDKFSLVFQFISNYKTYYNDTLYTYTDQLSPKIKVSIPANQFVVGEKAYPITSSSLFGSLAGEIHSSDISGAPYNDLWYVLESLALDPNTITIEAVSTGAINTTIAAEIFTELRTFFSKPKLQYIQSKPDWAGTGIWQKEINLPESTKTGSKLFLKDITFNYPRQFPIYTHEPKDGYEYRFMFQAPISSRSYASERELNFSYYSFESPARVISDFTDSLESSSSADYSAVHVYWDAGYREVFTADTELPYKYYVHQSFYDSCIFEFTLPDKSVKSISLLDLFKTGLTLPAGITSIKLSAILLPNIEGFVLNYFFKNNTTLINNLEPQHFYDALSAFSKINININIGYQSASEGIYIDTSKVRKLYIDEKEIESFIANE